MAHILITNDDGIQAEGLRALVQAVEGLGTISVVAPSHERSAAAQSLTLWQPIFWEQVAEREWAVEGTPADSVILALNKLLPNRPDLVISGVNRGGNLGENVFYSGTVGAAMEAAINHIPAMAVSVAHKGRGFRFEHAAKFARDLAQLVLAEGMPQGVLLNVNVPLVWNGSRAFHAAVQEGHAQYPAGGHRPARARLFLAARTRTRRRARSGQRLRRDF